MNNEAWAVLDSLAKQKETHNIARINIIKDITAIFKQEQLLEDVISHYLSR